MKTQLKTIQTFQNRQNNIKINLGAYSTAKALRGIEKKIQ